MAHCLFAPPFSPLTGVWTGYEVAKVTWEVLVLPVAALIVFVSRAVLCGKCSAAWVKNIVSIPRETCKLIGTLCSSTTLYWAACLPTSTTSSSRPSKPALCRSRWGQSPIPRRSRGKGDAQCPLPRQHFVFLCCDWQLEQFNMMETPVSSDSLYNQTSTLNYSQALMMGLTGGHCGLRDQQQQQQQHQQGYSSHGNIPNIILTGASLTSQVGY